MNAFRLPTPRHAVSQPGATLNGIVAQAGDVILGKEQEIRLALNEPDVDCRGLRHGIEREGKGIGVPRAQARPLPTAREGRIKGVPAGEIECAGIA